jgi:hypothetical protein
MRIRSRSALRSLLVVAALASVGLPALAQDGSMPSYAQREDTIQGTISRVDGAYTVYVRDKRGYVDHVTLRDGTVINPTGLKLQPGQSVTVYGFAQGSTFVANEIDTPYSSYGYGYGAPPPPSYYYPYAYPYPYPYPYPYYYGYPYPYYGVRIGVVFGPHYPYYRYPYRYPYRGYVRGGVVLKKR